MKQHSCSGVARLLVALAILITTFITLPHAHAGTTVKFVNNRTAAALLPYGGMAPIMDIEVTSDGARDEVVTSFDFAAVGGVAKTPIRVDIYVYENTVPGSLGRYVGTTVFSASSKMYLDVYLDFYQGLQDTRVLTVYAASRDTVNAGTVFGMRPIAVNGNGGSTILQSDQSMQLTLNTNLKIGTVKWQGGDGNITASAEHQNQLLGTFDVTVANENVTFTDLPMYITYYGKVDGISKITLQDEFGNKLAGPADLEEDGTGHGGYCFFSGPLKLSRGTHTIQVRGNPGHSGHNAIIACSFNAQRYAEQIVTLRGDTYSYWLMPDQPSFYMQSTKIATPAFNYTVRSAQSTIVSPGQRVLLGYIVINEDTNSDTTFEGILYKSVRLKFSQPIKGLLENLTLRFDWSLQYATTDMNFINNNEVQLNFINTVSTGRLTKNTRLLVEADVAEVGKVEEFTMYVEDETFKAVGADYGVSANAESVDSISFTIKIGPPADLWKGGHIQWQNRVAVTAQSDYYQFDIATLEAGRYVVQVSQGVDQPWLSVVEYNAQAESVAKVTTPPLVRKSEMFFRVKRL